MKYIKYLYLASICMPIVICASESPIGNESSIYETEEAYHKVIDDLFIQAHKSLAERENIITPEWLTGKEIEEIKNLMSDVRIILSFDVNAEKVMSEKLQDYLKIKIGNEVEKAFDSDTATIKGVRQLFYLSETVCNLSQGTDCGRMMRAIKDESFALRQNLKTQKKIRQQVSKEEMRRLCEIVAIGAQPRR